MTVKWRDALFLFVSINLEDFDFLSSANVSEKVINNKKFTSGMFSSTLYISGGENLNDSITGFGFGCEDGFGVMFLNGEVALDVEATLAKEVRVLKSHLGFQGLNLQLQTDPSKSLQVKTQRKLNNEKNAEFEGSEMKGFDDTYEEQVHRLKLEIVSLKEQNQLLAESNEEVCKKLVNSQIKAETLERNLQSANAHNDELQHQAFRLKEENKTFKEVLQKLEFSVREEKENLEEVFRRKFERLGEKHGSEVKCLKQNSSEHEYHLERCSRQLKERDKKIEELQRELKEGLKEGRLLKEVKEKREEQFRKLLEQMDGLGGEMDRIKADNELLKMHLREAQDYSRRMAEEVSTVKDKRESDLFSIASSRIGPSNKGQELLSEVRSLSNKRAAKDNSVLGYVKMREIMTQRTIKESRNQRSTGYLTVMEGMGTDDYYATISPAFTYN